MKTKRHIKEYFNISSADMLSEKLVSLLPNDDDVIYEPKGLFNKGIKKDTDRITGKKGKLYVRINRAGLYDILPKGLFHNKLDHDNNKPEFFERIELEKNKIRKLFLPFDSEIFTSKTRIERENLNHYRNIYDAEIAISIMDFYHLFNELDLLKIYEILFIDIVCGRQKGSNTFEVETYLKKLLAQNISTYELTVRLLEDTDGDSILLRLLNAIPFAPDWAGRVKESQHLLSYVLNKEVRISRDRRTHSYEGKSNHKIGWGKRLNADSNSLLLGNRIDGENVLLEIQVEGTAENMYFNRLFKYGCISEVIRVFMAYFMKISDEYDITICMPDRLRGAHDESLFHLVPFNQERNIRLADLRKQIQAKTYNVSVPEKSFYSTIDLDARVQMMKYFNLFFEHIFKDGKDHPLLKMNTKI